MKIELERMEIKQTLNPNENREEAHHIDNINHSGRLYPTAYLSVGYR